MPKGSGRRPKPTALKRLQGNPGKRKLNDREPKPQPGDPVMPRGLLRAAREEWNSIVPELRAMGVLSKVDGKALAAYCHAYARWFEAERHVRLHGIVVSEPIFSSEDIILGFRYKKNPAVTISEGAMKIMRSFLVEFGMTPSSRSRVRIEKSGEIEEDPLDAFLRGNASPSKHVN